MNRTNLFLFIVFCSFGKLAAQCVQPLNSGVTENLNGIYFFDADHGTAVGDNGQVLITTDGGDSWNASDANTSQHLQSVFMTSTNDIWAVGNRGIIRYSNDGGVTWSMQYSPTACHLTDVRFRGGNGIIVGECGIVLTASMTSNIWSSIRLTTTENLHNVRFIDDDIALVAGANGTIYRINISDGTSTQINAPNNADIIGFEINGNSLFLSDANGNIYTSNNGGNNWTLQTTNANNTNAIAAFDENKAIAVGQNASATKTTDTGAQWENLSVDPAITGNFTDVTFPDSTVAYATGSDGLIAKIIFLHIEAGVVSPVCEGETVSMNVNGPGVPVGYSWDGPVLNSDAPNPMFEATPADDGEYVVLVSTSGCATTDTFDLVVNNAPDATAVGGVLDCNSGGVELMGSSTVPMVSYLWAGPGIDASNESEQNPAVAATGTYTLTVTDANNCTATAIAEVTGDAEIPALEIDTISNTTELNCNTNSIDLEALFSISQYDLTWTLPDGSTSTAENITAQDSGLYVLNIINLENDCVNNTSINITQNINTPLAEASSIGEIDCSGGTVDLIAESDIGTTFVWVGPFPATDSLFGQTVNATQSGTYTLIVTADNGCSETVNETVAENMEAPFADIIASPGSTACVGETITLTVTTPAPNIEWETGETTESIDIDTTAGQFTYEVTVTDNNGCTNVVSTNITVNDDPMASATANDIDCDGNGEVMGNSPSTPVSYSWSGPNGFSSNEQNATVTEIGTYFLTVTNDDTGCTSTGQADVNFAMGTPDAMINYPTDTLTCTNETIQLAGMTTTPNAETEWFDENNISLGTNSIITVDTEGFYIFEVTNPDLPDCPIYDTVFIVDNTEAGTFDLVGEDIPCPGQTATLIAGPNSNITDITFTWNGTGTGDTLIVDVPGDYEVVGTTNSNGCTAFGFFTVNVLPAQEVSLGVDVEICNLTDNGYTLIPDPPQWESYEWSFNGETTSTLEVTSEGTYTVTVTNADGCSATNQVSVLESEEIQVSESIDLCEGTIYELGDTTISDSGVYDLFLDGGIECDTALTLTVNVIPIEVQSEYYLQCENEPLIIGDTTITSSGIYNILIAGTGGDCDILLEATVDFIPIDYIAPVINGNNAPCEGDTITFNIGSINSLLDYDWNPTGATTFNQTDSTITLIFGNTDTQLTTTVSDVLNCNIPQSSTITIDIVQLPITPSNLTADQTPCINETVIYEITPVPDAAEYIWVLPNGGMQTTTTTSSPAYTPTQAGPYTYSVIAANACGESDALIIDDIAFEAPTASINAIDTTCVGEPVTLTIELTGNGPWDVGYIDENGTTQTVEISTLQDNFTVNPSSSFTYQLISVEDSQCVGEASGQAVIEVVDVPETEVLDVEICEGDQYDFYGTIVDETNTYEHIHDVTQNCSYVSILNLTVVYPDSLSLPDTVLYSFESSQESVKLPLLENAYPDVNVILNASPTTTVEGLSIDGNQMTYSSGQDVEFWLTVSLAACPDVVDSVFVRINFRSDCFSPDNSKMPKAFIPEGYSELKNADFDPCIAVAECLSGTEQMDCSELKEIELVIFNGWGEIVFKTNDINNSAWTKEEANKFPEATYYYSLKVKYEDTGSNKIKTETIKGPISIVKKK